MNPIRRWHELVENRDTSGLDGILANEVVFHSPILHAPQAGKRLTTLYLAAAMGVLCNSSFRYVREAIGNHLAFLEFETEIGDIHINGVDIIHWDDNGLIDEFRVMIRPLKAIEAIHIAMKAALTGGA